MTPWRHCGCWSVLLQGTKIPFEQALAATFLEGILFMLVCITGDHAAALRLLTCVVMRVITPSACASFGKKSLCLCSIFTCRSNCRSLVGAGANIRACCKHLTLAAWYCSQICPLMLAIALMLLQVCDLSFSRRSLRVFSCQVQQALGSLLPLLVPRTVGSLLLLLSQPCWA